MMFNLTFLKIGLPITFELSCFLLVVSGIASTSNLKDNSLGMFVNPVRTCPESDWNPLQLFCCEFDEGFPPLANIFFQAKLRVEWTIAGDFAWANIPSGCEVAEWWKQIPETGPKKTWSTVTGVSESEHRRIFSKHITHATWHPRKNGKNTVQLLLRFRDVKYTPLKVIGWNTKIKVWFRWDSSSNWLFSGFILILKDVYTSLRMLCISLMANSTYMAFQASS